MAKQTKELTFEERVAAATATSAARMKDNRLKSDVAIDYELKKLSLDKMKTILESVYDLVGFDEEKLDFLVRKTSRRSEYGRISELITQVAKVYAWPVDSISEAKEIDGLQEDIIDMLAEKGIHLTHDLLMDIKESKGNHSFLDKTTYEIIDSVEPEYEELGLYLRTFAEYAGLPIIDYKLTENTWARNEMKSQKKIMIEHEAAQAELKKHNDLESA